MEKRNREKLGLEEMVRLTAEKSNGYINQTKEVVRAFLDCLIEAQLEGYDIELKDYFKLRFNPNDGRKRLNLETKEMEVGDPYYKVQYTTPKVIKEYVAKLEVNQEDLEFIEKRKEKREKRYNQKYVERNKK